MDGIYSIAGKERKRKPMNYGDFLDMNDAIFPDGVKEGEKVKIKVTKEHIFRLTNAVLDPPLTLEEFNGITDKKEMGILINLMKDAGDEMAEIAEEVADEKTKNKQLVPGKKN